MDQRKNKLLTIAVSAIVLAAGLILILPHVSNSPLRGPDVNGYISYENASAMPVNADSDPPAPASGTVEAFMPLLPNSLPAFTGTSNPVLGSEAFVNLGTSNVSNGNFSFAMNYSFYSTVNRWTQYYSHFRTPTPQAFVMFEINLAIQKSNVTDMYTFAYSSMFSPFNLSPSHSILFNIHKNFILSRPSAVIPHNLTAFNYSQYQGLIGRYGPIGPGGWSARTITTYTWVQQPLKTFSTVPFPLLIGHNLSALNLTSDGDYQGSATLGLINDSLNFTSAQAYANSSSGSSNFNDWNFQSSSTGTLSFPNGFVVSNGFQFPNLVGTSPSNSTAVIGLSNLTLNLEVYKLQYTTRTWIYHYGVLVSYSVKSGWTGNKQAQEFLTSQGGPLNAVVNYYPSWFSTAIQWLDQNKTVNGTLNPGQKISFDSINNQLSETTNSEAKTIADAADVAMASLGVIVAIAAGAEAISLGTAGPAAVIAEITAMTGVIAAVIAAVSSVVISAKSVTSVYASFVKSYYTQPLGTSVVVDPAVISVDGYQLTVASPLVEV